MQGPRHESGLPESPARVADWPSQFKSGTRQAVLGHTVSLASGLPLVAVDRRSNTDAFCTGEEDSHAPSVSRVQTDIADFHCPGTGKAALIAKHLCGHGFDDALSLAIKLGDDLNYFCGAPCCHATMRWASLSQEAQAWLKDAGLPGADAFALLTDIIRLARVGTGDGACTRWRLRQHLEDAEASLLGRKACRLIDEARLVRLEAQGLSVRLLEYCHPSLSPDNVLFLAKLATKEAAGPWPEPQLTSLPLPKPQLPPQCIMIELDPAAPQSLLVRLAAVLLEMKAAAAWPITVTGVADAANVLLCSVLADDPSELVGLLRHLSGHVLFQRVVGRLLPLSRAVPGMPELFAATLSELSGLRPTAPSEEKLTLRISARPKSIEASLCQLFPAHMLDPVHFTHVLTVIQGEDLRYSLLPRSSFDPSSWADAKRELRTVASKLPFRFLEACLRFKRLQSEAVLLWSEQEANLDHQWAKHVDSEWGSKAALAELHPISRSGWAARIESSRDISLVPVRGTWYPLEDGRLGARSSLLLADTNSTGQEAVLLVRRILQVVLTSPSPALATSGTVVLRLRCGRRPRAVKQWLKDMASMIEETSAKFSAVELLHLISDRENERTAMFNWNGLPEKDLCAARPDLQLEKLRRESPCMQRLPPRSR